MPDDWLARADGASGQLVAALGGVAVGLHGGTRAAPKAPGSDEHRPLTPAPGTYVVERVS